MTAYTVVPVKQSEDRWFWWTYLVLVFAMFVGAAILGIQQDRLWNEGCELYGGGWSHSKTGWNWVPCGSNPSKTPTFEIDQ